MVEVVGLQLQRAGRVIFYKSLGIKVPWLGGSRQLVVRLWK